MKFVVTGGLGFIGSNLVDGLIQEGHTVSVIDDLSTGNAHYRNEKATYFTESDGINNIKLLEKVTKGVDGIFHLAAWARLQRSINDPIGTNHANIDGTVAVLEAARRNKIKRVVFSSSSSVYGVQENPKMREDMPTNPMHFYALQKLTGERYARLYSTLFGMQVVCLRYFNVYGPRQIIQGDYALVIGKFLRQKKEKGKMTIYGDGKQTRAYTHVSDVVRANIAAMTYYMGDFKWDLFNIGTDIETSINEIAKMIGGDIEYIRPNPRGDFEERRKCADYRKARIQLGWIPQIKLEEGIKQLV